MASPCPEYGADMRFGLVGTGPWATMVHGPGLLEAENADLVGVWGRSADKAEALATSLGVTAYDDFDALLADAEAIAFAVPPDVQADLALPAARAGKHLLLEKPVAMDLDAARAVRDAAAEAGVASLVFFTDRFIEGSRAWFQQVHSTEGWRGGWVRWFASLQQDGNPFGGSAWRKQRGALWDVGPHVLSTMSAALGPIDSLAAVDGGGDLVTLVLRHETGATTTASITLFAPPAAEGLEAVVWGEAGLLPMPARPEEGGAGLFAAAADELVAAVADGQPHELDVVFGTRVVELLSEAQAQLDAANPR
jgi:predicted dehydrogenase